MQDALYRSSGNPVMPTSMVEAPIHENAVAESREGGMVVGTPDPPNAELEPDRQGASAKVRRVRIANRASCAGADAFSR